MNEECASLYSEISSVFPRTNSPGSGEITSDEYGDSMKVRLSLAGHKWWLVDDNIIDQNHLHLPLLTPIAFHYYLPAFLIRSLKHFVPDNETLIFTVYSLAPFKTSSDAPWFCDRKRQFTPAEVKTVIKFLHCILNDESMYSLYSDAERGLKKFWV